MKAKKARIADCPSCGSVIKIKGDNSIEETEREGYECGECGELYDDPEEAKDCCKA